MIEHETPITDAIARSKGLQSLLEAARTCSAADLPDRLQQVAIYAYSLGQTNGAIQSRRASEFRERHK
jgi:hypothetical protein